MLSWICLNNNAYLRKKTHKGCSTDGSVKTSIYGVTKMVVYTCQFAMRLFQKHWHRVEGRACLEPMLKF